MRLATPGRCRKPQTRRYFTCTLLYAWASISSPSNASGLAGRRRFVMLRLAVLISALSVVPAVASAQQPCTTDARRVVDELYRHMLERGTDRESDVWVSRLTSGSTVRDVV